MKNYEQLKIAIAEVIKNNGNREITGDVLQDVLLGMVSTLGNHATYAGIATPELNPDIADANVFFLTSTPGEYQFFGGIIVDENEIVALVHDNDVWTKQTINVSVPFNYNVTYAQLVELRDNAQLVPGAKYCINDYLATVVKESFSVRPDNIMMHIVVTAIDASHISEDAIAYVPNENFTEKEIFDVSYSLDNNTERFDWADVENGKGVIYRMVDYLNNEMPFDFVNIFIVGTSAFIAPYPIYFNGNPKNHKVYPVYNGRQMILREVRVSPWTTQDNIIKGSVINGKVITGSNNYVGYGSTVDLTGSNNHIDDNCSDIILLNSSNNNITSSSNIRLQNSENNIICASEKIDGNNVNLCEFKNSEITNDVIISQWLDVKLFGTLTFTDNIVPSSLKESIIYGPVTINAANIEYRKITIFQSFSNLVASVDLKSVTFPIVLQNINEQTLQGSYLITMGIADMPNFDRPTRSMVTIEGFMAYMPIQIFDIMYALKGIWQLQTENGRTLNAEPLQLDGQRGMIVTEIVGTSINGIKKQWRFIVNFGAGTVDIYYTISPISNQLQSFGLFYNTTIGSWDELKQNYGLTRDDIEYLCKGVYTSMCAIQGAFAPDVFMSGAVSENGFPQYAILVKGEFDMESGIWKGVQKEIRIIDSEQGVISIRIKSINQ